MNIRLKVIQSLPVGFWFVSNILSPVNASAATMPAFPLAQVPPALKTSFQLSLGIIFLIGFIWGVVKIWSGADRMSKGDADGKAGLLAGIVIAGAAAIMGAFFSVFGMSDGVLTPQF